MVKLLFSTLLYPKQTYFLGKLRTSNTSFKFLKNNKVTNTVQTDLLRWGAAGSAVFWNQLLMKPVDETTNPRPHRKHLLFSGHSVSVRQKHSAYTPKQRATPLKTNARPETQHLRTLTPEGGGGTGDTPARTAQPLGSGTCQGKRGGGRNAKATQRLQRPVLGL